MGTVKDIQLTALTTTTQYYYGLPSPGEGMSYVWNFVSPEASDQQWALSPIANNVIVTYQGLLPYTGDQHYLQVEVTDNCGSSVTQQIALPIPGGKPPRRMASKNAEDNISIFPNPAYQRIKLVLPESWSYSSIRLLDLKTGMPIREWKCDNAVFETTLEGIAAGIYLLEFHGQDRIQRQRLEVAP